MIMEELYQQIFMTFVGVAAVLFAPVPEGVIGAAKRTRSGCSRPFAGSSWLAGSGLGLVGSGSNLFPLPSPIKEALCNRADAEAVHINENDNSKDNHDRGKPSNDERQTQGGGNLNTLMEE